MRCDANRCDAVLIQTDTMSIEREMRSTNDRCSNLLFFCFVGVVVSSSDSSEFCRKASLARASDPVLVSTDLYDQDPPAQSLLRGPLRHVGEPCHQLVLTRFPSYGEGIAGC